MATRRSRTATATNPADAELTGNPEGAVGDFNPAELEAQSPPTATALAEPPEEAAAQSADEPAAKKWAKPPNPMSFEGKYGKDRNGVHLLKSEPEERNENGAWVIRFDVPPNTMEGYSKENPHPVLAYLKSEGYHWGFDHDGKGGWGKEWGREPYGTDHDEARKVLAKAAEMVGVTLDQGRIPD